MCCGQLVVVSHTPRVALKPLGKSGIVGGKKGLGTSMAVNGVSVDLIAQVLGHNGTKATKRYISADVERLRECALDLMSLGGDL